MNQKKLDFYKNKKNIFKEIRGQIRNIALILNKQKNEMKISQAEESLKNDYKNYEKK